MRIRSLIITLTTLAIGAACNPLQTEIDYYKQKVESIDDNLFSVQTSIATYYSMLKRVNENDFIVEVIPLKEEARIVGYYLTFSKGEKLTLFFGKDGEKGEPGKDGEDGADGYSPELKLVKYRDGNSYWTVNGILLVDSSGNKIAANGDDGSSPRLKLDGKIWMISYDGGTSWAALGSSVMVSVSVFKYAEMADEGKVDVYLQDGEQFSIPVYKTMKLSLDKADEFEPGTAQSIRYQINGKADDDSEIELSYSISQGWRVEIARDSKFSGSLNITPPETSGAKADLIFFCSSDGQTVSDHQSLVAKEIDPGQTVDLSKDGRANCYVVSKPGKYSFNCSFQGGSSNPVSGIASADVLWETFGTTERPNVGDVISDVRYGNGRISFSSNRNGNAVIAAKDASGTILWSWHIWVCKGFYPAGSAQIYYNNAGTMMDRNLGALSATPGDVKSYGLFYQWGRKDPFPGAGEASKDVTAAISRDVMTFIKSDKTTGTLSYAIQHPTTFIGYNSNNLDWLYSGNGTNDNTRWNEDRLRWDPCPYGWRVPESDVWAVALGQSGIILEGTWIQIGGMNFGKNSQRPMGNYAVIWYPLTGCVWDYDGSLSSVGSDGSALTTTPINQRVSILQMLVGRVTTHYVGARAYGIPVRCQAIK